MAFRDDRDALLARVAALESERDQLRAGADPALRRLRTRFAVVTIVMLVGTGVFVVVEQLQRSEDQADQDRRAEQLTEMLAQNQADADRAQAELNELRAERDALAAAPPEPARAPMPIAPPPEGISLVGSVTAITGRPGVRVGTECSVDVTYGMATRDCHANVVCAGTVLYAPRNEGFFACEVENGHIVRGHDDNPTDPSGDPRLELDVEHATLLVSDTPPAWSVTLRWTPPNPF